MRTIAISRATHDLLAAAAERGGVPVRLVGARELPDGRVEFEVDEEVFSCLEALAPGDPDAAVRLACTPGGFGRA